MVASAEEKDEETKDQRYSEMSTMLRCPDSRQRVQR